MIIMIFYGKEIVALGIGFEILAELGGVKTGEFDDGIYSQFGCALDKWKCNTFFKKGYSLVNCQNVFGIVGFINRTS